MEEENIIKVLLVEDEPALAMIVRDVLSKQGFTVEWAPNGQIGLKKFHDFNPDIVVADIMMPELDGIGMIRQIRKVNKKIPVIFLSAKSKSEDVVQGFEAGGNDYLKKPFGMDELIIRIKSLLNREFSSKEKQTIYKIGNYTFDVIHQTLSINNTVEHLSHRETELLELLCLNKNSILEHKPVLLEFWGDDDFFSTRSLHGFIVKLRKKLAKDPDVNILNIRGTGYKLTC